MQLAWLEANHFGAQKVHNKGLVANTVGPHHPQVFGPITPREREIPCMAKSHTKKQEDRKRCGETKPAAEIPLTTAWWSENANWGSQQPLLVKLADQVSGSWHSSRQGSGNR